MKLPTILVSNKNTWKVEGRLRAFYWVTRNRKRFWCSCPARCLCRHIKAVVKANAVLEGWDRVRFFNSDSDVSRQKKRTVMMEAHGKAFWVTYSCEWAREFVPPGERFAGVKRDRWFQGPGQRFDVFSWKDGLRGRTAVRRA